MSDELLDHWREYGAPKRHCSYEEQDKADSNSLYHTLENKIIPAYYHQDKNNRLRF